MTLGGAEAAGLSWLVRFMEPILGDAVRERLRKKTSPEKALQASHALYESLVRLRTRSSQFVDMLKEMAEIGPQVRLGSWHESPLADEMGRLEDALFTLDICVSAVDPQLMIHAPEIVTDISAARENRALVVTQARSNLNDWAAGTRQEEIMQVLWNAQESHRRIEAAIEDYRRFLAAEFPYRESF
ncbi:hypothetical protein ACWGII_26165 [Streptomyces sp. NPDC054855]